MKVNDDIAIKGKKGVITKIYKNIVQVRFSNGNEENIEINYLNFCNQCNILFEDHRDAERHGWEKHPSNDIEKAWANKDWSKWTGSTYYMDDPYY
jgi:hypothetical protein